MNYSRYLFFSLFSVREHILIHLVKLAYTFYSRFYKLNKPAWTTSLEELLEYPPNSLGKELAHFMEKYHRNLMPRFEDHDVFLVLLDYQPTIIEEAQMQFCLLGNGKWSINVLGTVFLATIIFPEYWRFFKMAYQRGKDCNPFTNWQFEHLLKESVLLLRQLIFKNPIYDPPLFI